MELLWCHQYVKDPPLVSMPMLAPGLNEASAKRLVTFAVVQPDDPPTERTSVAPLATLTLPEVKASASAGGCRFQAPLLTSVPPE